MFSRLYTDLMYVHTKIMNSVLWDQSGGVFRKEAERSGGGAEEEGE